MFPSKIPHFGSTNICFSALHDIPSSPLAFWFDIYTRAVVVSLYEWRWDWTHSRKEAASSTLCTSFTQWESGLARKPHTSESHKSPNVSDVRACLLSLLPPLLTGWEIRTFHTLCFLFDDSFRARGKRTEKNERRRLSSCLSYLYG